MDINPLLTSLKLLNFRKFENIDIVNIKQQHLFIGKNGSGKTSIMWAIILMLYGYNDTIKDIFINYDNFNMKKVKKEYSKNGHLSIGLDTLAKILSYRAFLHADSIFYFINKNIKVNNANIIADINNIQYNLNIDRNKGVNINPIILTKPEIYYGFMGTDIMTMASRSELYSISILTNGMNNIRNLCLNLKNNHNELYQEFYNILIKLFNVTEIKIRSDGYGENLYIASDNNMINELIYQCAGLRKVFSALTILYNICSKDGEKNKIFMIEEPEANLAPDIRVNFLEILFNICYKYHVQLLITAYNDSHVVKYFQEDEICDLDCI